MGRHRSTRRWDLRRSPRRHARQDRFLGPWRRGWPLRFPLSWGYIECDVRHRYDLRGLNRRPGQHVGAGRRGPSPVVRMRTRNLRDGGGARKRSPCVRMRMRVRDLGGDGGARRRSRHEGGRGLHVGALFRRGTPRRQRCARWGLRLAGGRLPAYVLVVGHHRAGQIARSVGQRWERPRSVRVRGVARRKPAPVLRRARLLASPPQTQSQEPPLPPPVLLFRRLGRVASNRWRRAAVRR